MKTLYGKLSLALGGLLVTTGLAYVLISHALTQRYLEQAAQRFNDDLARNLVAERNLVSAGRLDKDAVKETFSLYMTINPSIEIYLLDLQGQILAYSADSGVVKRKRVALAPIQTFLNTHDDRSAVFPILGDDPRSHARQKIFSVTTVPTTERPEGYLYVVLRGESYDSIERLYQDSLLARLSLWTLFGSLLFALLVGLLIFYGLTRRLRRLTGLLGAFQDSQFELYTPYTDGTDSASQSKLSASGDEIDQLGSGFDLLAERLQAMLNELRARDTLRRELVSHVSHDLRTPLTCLHGYLQTLKLKSVQLDGAERSQYLELALGHSERLGSLVGELFDLAKLDAHVVKPQLEPFTPAELLQDLRQKFLLLAKQRGIALDLIVANECSTVLATADLGMIDRVLENLITNALDHTAAKGKVFLQLSRSTQQPERLKIVVQDTGSGIAKADLPYIFDRFYRGRQRRPKDGNHVGLGLVIAKRMIELHGSQLQVQSQVGRGTQFSFTLAEMVN